MRILLAANDGGHLKQLWRLSSRLTSVEDEVRWMSVRTAQAESILANRDVEWMHPAPTRDYKAVFRNAGRARRLIAEYEPNLTVSTGSSLALSVLPLASAHGSRAIYVESATRVDGPSVTGRILRRIPGVVTFTQSEKWASQDWEYRGSVFDGFEVVPRAAAQTSTPMRVVVSLGTSATYQFPRMAAVVAEVAKGAEITWQLGSTEIPGLSGSVHQFIPALELEALMAEADVVIAHAGTGVALSALEAGKVPILIPRRPDLQEHVDDHQLQIASMLGRRRLAIIRDPADLTVGDLRHAASLRARPTTVQPLDLT